MANKLSDLEKRAEQLKAQFDNAQSRLKEEKRRRTTRKKIIMGAALLTALEKEQDNEKAERLEAYLLRFVSKKDRAFLESCK